MRNGKIKNVVLKTRIKKKIVVSSPGYSRNGRQLEKTAPPVGRKIKIVVRNA